MSDPNELQWMMQYVGVLVTNSLPRLATETAFFALYSVVATTAVLSVRRRRTSTLSRKLVLAACAVMYCVALIHYILVFHWVLVDNHRSNVLKDAAISCYQTLDTSTFQGSLCLQGIDEITGSIAAESDAALAALLLINIVLSAAILLWRTCTLWPRSLALKIISGFLVLILAIMLAVSAGLGDGAVSPEVPTSSTSFLSNVGTEFEDVFGTTGITFMFVITILVAVLVSIKLWSTREQDSAHEATLPKRAERLAVFLLDSGILYCFFWVLLIASFIEWAWPFNSSEQHYLDFIAVLKGSALIDIVGIYPTLLVILGSFNSSSKEQEYEAQKV